MEEPYRIDRMLFQLKLSGLLDKVSGVILGSFRKCTPEEPEKSFTLEQVFEQHFKTFNKPVFYGAQIGHVRDKFTLPIGVIASMNASSGTITLLEPSVV
jgi:muramoyltetrapeptide carboxypeptidase